MTPTLQRILTAHGSFPDLPDVMAGFAEVLRLSQGGGEPAADVAAALLTLVDQLADLDQTVPEDLGTQLTDWAERAAEDPGVSAAEIVALLVNADTARAASVLEALAQRQDRAELAEAAAEGLAEVRSTEPAKAT